MNGLGARRPERALTIFVPHASELLTDREAHGDGLVAYEIVVRLAERGHRLHVLAPRIDVRASLPSNLLMYEIAPRPRQFVHPRLSYMLAVRRLYERIKRRESIDLVHQLNPVFTGISLALGGASAPRILGSFVPEWPPPQGRGRGPLGALRGSIAALQQRDAAALLVTTPAACEHIVEVDRCAPKIVTIPHGVDTSRFTAAEKTTRVPTILFLGRLEECKGIYSLISAFRLVRAALPDAVLVVAGSGSEWHRMANAVDAAGLSESVRFIGAVSREAVPRVISESSVLCLPSYGEPFGMVILEAMASAKPVVATDAGGAAHLVTPQGGRKAPPASPADLADALVEILKSPSLAHGMGRHNREVAEQRYNWPTIIDWLESVYADVIARSS